MVHARSCMRMCVCLRVHVYLCVRVWYNRSVGALGRFAISGLLCRTEISLISSKSGNTFHGGIQSLVRPADERKTKNNRDSYFTGPFGVASRPCWPRTTSTKGPHAIVVSILPVSDDYSINRDVNVCAQVFGPGWLTHLEAEGEVEGVGFNMCSCQMR